MCVCVCVSECVCACVNCCNRVGVLCTEQSRRKDIALAAFSFSSSSTPAEGDGAKWVSMANIGGSPFKKPLSIEGSLIALSTREPKRIEKQSAYDYGWYKAFHGRVFEEGFSALFHSGILA